MRQGDIFFAGLEPAVGREQSGKRPVLVISSDDLNHRTQAPIVLPITRGGGSAVRLGLAVSLPPSLRTTGIVRSDQPRAIDLSARGARYVESVSNELPAQVLERFISIFDPAPESS